MDKFNVHEINVMIVHTLARSISVLKNYNFNFYHVDLIGLRKQNWNHWSMPKVNNNRFTCVYAQRVTGFAYLIPNSTVKSFSAKLTGLMQSAVFVNELQPVSVLCEYVKIAECNMQFIRWIPKYYSFKISCSAWKKCLSNRIWFYEPALFSSSPKLNGLLRHRN